MSCLHKSAEQKGGGISTKQVLIDCAFPKRTEPKGGKNEKVDSHDIGCASCTLASGGGLRPRSPAGATGHGAPGSRANGDNSASAAGADGATGG